MIAASSQHQVGPLSSSSLAEPRRSIQASGSPPVLSQQSQQRMMAFSVFPANRDLTTRHTLRLAEPWLSSVTAWQAPGVSTPCAVTEHVAVAVRPSERPGRRVRRRQAPADSACGTSNAGSAVSGQLTVAALPTGWRGGSIAELSTPCWQPLAHRPQSPRRIFSIVSF